jgi:uncharacterized membrane protein YphA (DoxX/SURF4 family)
VHVVAQLPHRFRRPNSGWIGVLIAVAEWGIGIALVLGVFTRLAALGSLVLLFTYVMSGTASVCACYALFAIVILVTWKTANWIGVDGVIASYRQHHHGPTHNLFPRRHAPATANPVAAPGTVAAPVS